jgi:zinc-ribbon domain
MDTSPETPIPQPSQDPQNPPTPATPASPPPAALSAAPPPTSAPGVSPAPPAMSASAITSPLPLICPQCHQPVQAGEYFCPNCGKKLNDPPLSTSVATQAWIYAFSVILPVICFLAVSYWPGIKYFRSDDPKARQIGMIAIALMTISTIITFWLAIAWIQGTVQESVNAVNSGNF